MTSFMITLPLFFSSKDRLFFFKVRSTTIDSLSLLMSKSFKAFAAILRDDAIKKINLPQLY